MLIDVNVIVKNSFGYKHFGFASSLTLNSCTLSLLAQLHYLRR